MNPFIGKETYTKAQLKDLLSFILVLLNAPENEQLLFNLNFIFNNIRDSMGKYNGSLLLQDMNPEDIQKKIEEFLPVRENEKNKLGEVFTPTTLINEMLDNLPTSVWSNPKLKWLDPANGIGNFPMMVYIRLIKGLESKMPNKTERSKHILKNMLYKGSFLVLKKLVDRKKNER